MVPVWVLVGAIVPAVALGFALCLAWTARPLRSEHSFYDPAVSVSATIQRVHAQPHTSESEAEDGDDDPGAGYAEYECGDRDDLWATVEHAEGFPAVDARPHVPTGSPIVRFYFTDVPHSRLSDGDTTIVQPGGALPVPGSRNASGSPRLPRHALREQAIQ